MRYDKLFLMFLLVVGSLMVVSAAYSLTNPQLVQGGTFSSFERDVTDTSFDSSACQEGQDFIIQVAPFGCEPAVVRSDLLEEQDVPVFCQLQAYKINPFIDVTAINSIKINGEYPRDIKAVGFTPSYAALGENRELNSLQWDEIGYATIVLRQNPNESSMPDSVEVNLSATLKYDLENAFGLRRHTFYLPIMTDSEFDRYIGQYAFFNNMGYLRAENVGEDSASIAIYSGRYEAPFGKSREGEIERQRIGRYDLQVGQDTGKIYLPGFDCFSSVKFSLNDIEFQDTRVRFSVNSQVIEVKENEKFLEDSCYVKDIESMGLNQIVKLYCQEDKGSDTFDLRISPKVKLEIGGVEAEYEVGDYLFQTDDLRYAYLGFVGSKTYEAKDLVAYIVIADDRMAQLGESEILAAGKLGEMNPENEAKAKQFASTVVGISANFVRWLIDGDSFKRLEYYDEIYIGNTKVEMMGFGSESDFPITSDIEKYYENALEDYDYIFSNYQGEVYPEDEEITLGENATYTKMILAKDIYQKKDLKFFCDEFKTNFPDSTLDTSFCDDLVFLSNEGVSTRELMIDGNVKQLSFEGVYQPSFEDYGIELYVKAKNGNVSSHELRKEQMLYLDEKREEYVQFISIVDEDTAVIKIQVDDKTFLQRTGDLASQNRRFDQDIAASFGNYTFVLKEVNFERVAKVTVDPGVSYVGSEVDFNFAVGIEKRGIQLSPEMTQNMIDKLDNTIEIWEDISAGLGNTVDFLEDACLAVGGVLTIKNLLFNSGGESIARQEVMNGAGGWYERCAEMVARGNYTSEGDCLEENADEIDNEVNLLAEMLSSQNSEIKKIQEDESVSHSQGFLGGTVVNTTKLVEEYLPQVKASLEKRGEFIEDPSGKGKKVSYSSLESVLTIEGWRNNLFSLDLLKEIELYSNVLNEGGLTEEQTESYESKLYEVVKQVDTNSEKYVDVNNWASSLGINSEKVGFVTVGDKATGLPYDGVVFEGLDFSETKEFDVDKISSHVYVLNLISQMSGTYKSGINVDSLVEKLHEEDFLNDEQYQIMIGEGGDGFLPDVSYLNEILPINKNTKVKLLQSSAGGKYIIFLEDSGLDELPILEDDSFNPYIYNKKGNRLPLSEIPTEIRNIYCIIYDESSYQNSYKNPELTYYETDPYKGLPAVVPFDLNDGWYAYVEQSVDSFSDIRSYDQSARVNSFWLCNVGNNGLEEFSKGGTGDDICQLINLGTGQPYNQFSGLEENDAANLIDDAVNAIEAASRAYRDGVRTVKIGDYTLEVGSPAIAGTLSKCEDYMSPKDCKILFNVCDPVICPSSRCDFGGQYPVQDVIQSGIIGSLLLCLPNYNEGIYMPVCLTGVKSGLDSYLSVMESYQSCLQESLDTGQTIGICDQINSIYLCEFFWRQALPLAELTLPKIVGAITKENTRGGGEYSRLDTAWDNAKNSVNFFTEFYAVNSLNAFKARSQEEIGSEVCKSFISVSYPEGQGILDSLTIHDSPPQYSGNFEEIPFTTATVPPTSQYKVFYHIYAGEDQGAYYKVYLRGGSGSSYYQDTFSGRMVASGYIPVGEYATGTEDFTAPEGYQELCIAVNNDEECGFKQVSTSFAFDYVRDKSRQAQIEDTNIQSQEECISGSANIYGLLNLNVQEGVSNTINPEIYNQGIVRICATENPGLGSDPYVTTNPRWVDVGYCSDSNIRCWMDQESIDRALEFQTHVNESLEVLANRSRDNIINKEGYLTPEQFASAVDNISKEEDREKRFELIKGLFDKVYWNNHKAYLYYLRGGLYGEIVMEKFAELDIEGEKRMISGVTMLTCGEKVYSVADGYAESGYDHLRSDGFADNPCASFVSKVLTEAGVNEPDIYANEFLCQAIDLLIADSLKNETYFEELYTYDDYQSGRDLPTLEAGDVVIFGNKNLDDRTQHATIFVDYNGKSAVTISDPGQSSIVMEKEYGLAYEDGWHVTYAYRVIECGEGSAVETGAEVEMEVKDIVEEVRIDESLFTEKQLKTIYDAEDCDDCKNNWFNSCTKEQCEAVGINLGKQCAFGVYEDDDCEVSTDYPGDVIIETIFFRESWAKSYWPNVDALSFRVYEIDLVDIKFIESPWGDTLYASSANTEDPFAGTWELADSIQTGAYEKGKNYVSSDVRITWDKGGTVQSFPLVDVGTYKRFDYGGEDTKFVKDLDDNLFSSVDGGNTWVEIQFENVIGVYNSEENVNFSDWISEEVIEVQQVVEEEITESEEDVGEKSVEERRIKYNPGFFGAGSSPLINQNSFRKLEVDLVDTKFVKDMDDDLYVSTDYTEDPFDGDWDLADSAEKVIYSSNSDSVSSEVRIEWHRGATAISYPIVDVATYKRFDYNGQDTKFVKGLDGDLYFSVDSGNSWEKTDFDAVTNAYEGN